MAAIPEEVNNPIMKVYSRVDQEQLEKIGMAHKSEFNNDQGGLKAMQKYSLLQRFRGG